MIIRKFQIAEMQLNRAITLFLKVDDFVSALTLAGASEEILGQQLSREGGESAFTFLHDWYQREKKIKIDKKEFSRYANGPRNTLKHFNDPDEDPIEVFRWETVQMLMRAISNYHALTKRLTPEMKEFRIWVENNKEVFETLE